MAKNIYIRVDASPEIGMGHLMRCIALSHMLKDTFPVVFFLKKQKSSFISLLQQHGMKGIEIEDEEAFFLS